MPDKNKAKKNPLRNLGVPEVVAEKWEGLRPTFAEAEEEAGEILIYGPIVDSIDAGWLTEFYGEDVVISAKIFREKLNAIEGDVLVRINSPGGDVWEASGIVNAIIERRNGGDKVNMCIDGLAASAATLVMVSGEHVKIAKLANVMIHESSTFMYGNKKDLRKAADLLDKVDTQAVTLYAERMDQSEDEIMTLLEEETWYSPEEAVEAGLADEVVEPDAKKAKTEPKAKAQKDDDEERAEFLSRRYQRMAALGVAA